MSAVLPIESETKYSIEPISICLKPRVRRNTDGACYERRVQRGDLIKTNERRPFQPGYCIGADRNDRRPVPPHRCDETEDDVVRFCQHRHNKCRAPFVGAKIGGGKARENDAPEWIHLRQPAQIGVRVEVWLIRQPIERPSGLHDGSHRQLFRLRRHFDNNMHAGRRRDAAAHQFGRNLPRFCIQFETLHTPPPQPTELQYTA